MFSSITYRQKIRLSVIGFATLLVLSYPLSISKTINEYRTYTQNKDLHRQFMATGNSLSASHDKETNIRSILSQYTLDTADNSKNLLAITAAYCTRSNIRLKEYKPYAISEINGLKILTRHVTIEGSFVDCLKLIYQMEKENKAGRVSSVAYKTTMNNTTRHPELNCSIYIQNLILNQYETK